MKKHVFTAFWSHTDYTYSAEFSTNPYLNKCGHDADKRQ